MGAKDVAEEFVLEEGVTKDVADEADSSNFQNTHHLSETSWEKWRILARS